MFSTRSFRPAIEGKLPSDWFDRWERMKLGSGAKLDLADLSLFIRERGQAIEKETVLPW